MKFVRNNLNIEGIKEPDKELEKVVVTHDEGVAPKTLSELKEIVDETLNKPDVKTQSDSITPNSLEEKYKIPEFTPHVRPDVGEKVLKVNGEDVKGVEGVDEVPEGEDVLDGLEIDGDVSHEVQEQLDALTSVKDEEILTQNVTLLETADECEPFVSKQEPFNYSFEDSVEHDDSVVEEKEEASIKSSDGSVAWKKFVDLVIISTICTILDRTKEYVTTVLADELKESDPEVKD